MLEKYDGADSKLVSTFCWCWSYEQQHKKLSLLASNSGKQHYFSMHVSHACCLCKYKRRRQAKQ